MNDGEVEALTQDYGRELFARCPRSGPLLFSPRWWDDRLMEWSMGEKQAEQAQQEYFDLVRGLASEVNDWPEVPLIDRDADGPLPRANVSVKLSSLYSQLDAIDPVGSSEAVRRRLRPILREARRQRAFVNFDMESHSHKDLTLRIFRDVLEEDEFRDWPDVGVAMQA